MCLAGPVAGVQEKPSGSHAAERRSDNAKWREPPSYFEFINSIFTSYVLVIISECIIPCVHVHYLFVPNEKNIVSISVGIVVCRSIWNSTLLVAESWLLPYRDTSRKPWRGSVSIEDKEKTVAQYLL